MNTISILLLLAIVVLLSQMKQVLMQSSSYECETDLECLQILSSISANQIQLMREQISAMKDQHSELLQSIKELAKLQLSTMKLQMEQVNNLTSPSSFSHVLMTVAEFAISSVCILVLVPFVRYLYGKCCTLYVKWQINRTVQMWTRTQAELIRFENVSQTFTPGRSSDPISAVVVDGTLTVTAPVSVEPIADSGQSVTTC